MKLIFYFFLFAMGINGFAQTSSASVDSILKIHVEKLGGEKLLKSIETIKMERILYSNNIEIPQTTSIILNKGIYQKTFMPNSVMIVSLLNGKGWQINPFISNDPVNLKDTEIGMYTVASRFLTPICDYVINGEDSYVKNVELIENDTKSKLSLLQMEVTYKSGYKESLFLNSETFMVVKINNGFGTTTFSNFKSFEGILIAQNSIINNPQGIIDSDLISIQINPNIDVKEFEKK